jgi:hypothetical protein
MAVSGPAMTQTTGGHSGNAARYATRATKSRKTNQLRPNHAESGRPVQDIKVKLDRNAQLWKKWVANLTAAFRQI